MMSTAPQARRTQAALFVLACSQRPRPLQNFVTFFQQLLRSSNSVYRFLKDLAILGPFPLHGIFDVQIAKKFDPSFFDALLPAGATSFPFSSGATIIVDKASERTVRLNFKLFECESNAWIGNADAPAISFSEGFDFLDPAIVLVSPRPHNRQLVFEYGARYMISEAIFD